MRRFVPSADTFWGAIGLALVAAGWSFVAWHSGPFVLPPLADTGRALVRVIADGSAATAAAVTLAHAVGGGLIGALAGFALGLGGGRFRPLGAALGPVATAILGVPPVAWIVLAFLWFGTGFAAPLFTVAVTALPIVFAGTLNGVRARDPGLAEMAAVFRVPARARLRRIVLPELAVHVAPSLQTAFAISWKVALTAEVLGDGSGIGGRFAVARAHLDLAEAMAWVVLVVGLLLVADGVLLGPLRGWIAAQSGRRRAPTSAATRAPAAPSCVGVGALRTGGLGAGGLGEERGR